MAIKGFHHVAIFTDDLVKSRKFYEALGGNLVHSFESPSNNKEIDLIKLAEGATVELIQKPAPKMQGSFPHLAIETDDIEGLFEIATKAGASVDSPIKQMFLGDMEVKNCFLIGPDSEIIELFEVL